MVDKVLPSTMNIELGQSVTQDLSFQNSVEIQMSVPGACGPRLYSFSPALPTFVIFDQVLETITISTVETIDLGTHEISFSVYLQSYPIVPSLSKTLSLTIVEPPCDITQIKVVVAPASIKFYLHVDKIIEIPFSFEETPTCGLKFSLSPSYSFIQLDPIMKIIRVSTEDD